MLEENRRPLVIGGVAVAVIVVLIGSLLLFRGGAQTKLIVQSIPGDLTLRLDGHEIPANGEIKVKSGRHTLQGSRRGFQSYSQEVDLTGDALQYKMYLYANGPEGYEWTSKNPEQERELEAEAGRHFDEMQARLLARYPVISYLPYIGDGFEATRETSKSAPNNPEALSVGIEVYGPQGKTKALQWINSNGWDPASLDIIWTTGK